jgi:O-acetyl-ADP-ribose deacetylase (regulator of RNase III)
LELAEKNNLRNVAFCCISTGEFHFPNDKAAQIAIQTVKEYRQETHTKMEVIFNVFKDEDYKIYRDSSGQIEQLKKELAQTDAVVIGAGAGLSTSAGFVI